MGKLCPVSIPVIYFSQTSLKSNMLDVIFIFFIFFKEKVEKKILIYCLLDVFKRLLLQFALTDMYPAFNFFLQTELYILPNNHHHNDIFCNCGKQIFGSKCVWHFWTKHCSWYLRDLVRWNGSCNSCLRNPPMPKVCRSL